MLDTTQTAKDAVRKVLDAVRKDGRDSLTAPEGKLVCDAYGIAVPKEGVANSAEEAVQLAAGMGACVLKIVSPDILHKTEAGGVLVGLKSADEVRQGYDTILANAKKYKADAKILGVQVQQMLQGGQEVIVGAVTDGSFGKLVAFGMGGVLVEVLKDITFRLAPAIARRRALHARRHPGGRDAARRARQRAGQPRRAGRPDRPRVRAGQRLPRDLGDGPEPGVRLRAGRDRRRRAHRRRLQPGAGALPAAARRNRHRDEPHHAPGRGRGDRRLGRGRQDRQLGDEEPHQRRLQGQDLPDPPEGHGDPRLQGVQIGQGRAGDDRRRRVRDPGQVRRRSAHRMRREADPRRRADPLRLRRDRQRGRPARNPGDRPEVQHPADGAEHLRLLLHAEGSLRDVLHRL